MSRAISDIEEAGNMVPSKVETLFLEQPNKRRKTFELDNTLPSLPLPDLQHTLARYLDSLKPFTCASEFRRTAKVVESFGSGIGAILHSKLKAKAECTRNWLETWWEEYAYLRGRDPLLPYHSMVGVAPRIGGWCYGSEEDQIEHAALICYHTVTFWILLRREEIKPTETGSKRIVFSMAQYRRLFNTTRLPGEKIDKIVSYFKTEQEGSCPSNVVVMCRGRFFNVHALHADDTQLTPLEWEQKLREILELCSDRGRGQNVGILTCDTRNNWSKNRNHLIEISHRNKGIMNAIDGSIFVIVLDDDSPESVDAVSQYNLTGDYNNRWADKSMVLIFYKNGLWGTVCDHSAFDGISSTACLFYSYCALEESNGGWQGRKEMKGTPPVEELIVTLDKRMQKEIARLSSETVARRKKVLIKRMNFDDYGKKGIQSFSIHPDSYVQLGLQLAYYRMHNKPGPCYETATTRAFFNGRTETLRSCTSECVEWVRAMLNNRANNCKRMELLKTAVKRHDELMSEARENKGCDRHLFGLNCIALEEGLGVPELYSDPAFSKSGGNDNFVLSTSCTGFTPMSGGVAPMCKDGYGVFYNILPDGINFVISTNTQSDETNAVEFFSSLKTSLLEMRNMILGSRKFSKL